MREHLTRRLSTSTTTISLPVFERRWHLDSEYPPGIVAEKLAREDRGLPHTAF